MSRKAEMASRLIIAVFATAAAAAAGSRCRRNAFRSRKSSRRCSRYMCWLAVTVTDDADVAEELR